MNSIIDGKIYTAVIPHWWGGRDVVHVESEKIGETHQIHVQVFNQTPLARLGLFLLNFFKRKPPQSQLEPYYGKPVYKNTIKHVTDADLENTKVQLNQNLQALLTKRQVLQDKRKELEKALTSIEENIHSKPVQHETTVTPPLSNHSVKTISSSPTSPDTLEVPDNTPAKPKLEPQEPAPSDSLKNPEEPKSESQKPAPVDSHDALETPSPGSETQKIPQSQEQIETEKEETEDLLQEIDAEQQATGKNLRLNDTIQKTKDAALDALDDLFEAETEETPKQPQVIAEKPRNLKASLSKCKMLKDELMKKINSKMQPLPVVSNKNMPKQAWQTTFDTLRRSFLEERANVWKNLSKLASETPENFEALNSLNEKVTQEGLIDEQLDTALSFTPTRSCMDILWRTYPNPTFADVMSHTIKEIAANAKTLLQSVSVEDQTFFETKFANLEKDSTLTLEDFQSLVSALLTASRSWIKSENLPIETKTDLYNICNSIQGLNGCLSTILKAHNDFRENFLRKAGGGIASVQAIANHFSISTIYDGFIKTALWTPQMKLTDLRSGEKSWAALVEYSKKVRTTLKTLATTHAAYAKSLNTARTYIETTKDDNELNNDVIINLQRRIAGNKHISENSATNLNEISKYQAIVAKANDELTKLITNVRNRTSSREAILQQIANFLKEIEGYHTKLQHIEKTYHLHLNDAHNLLDKQQQIIEGLKESALLPTRTILPDWNPLRVDSNLKRLDNNTLKIYQQVVKTTIDQSRIALKAITQTNDKYTLFETQFKKVEDRIAELKTQGLTSHAAKLELAFKNIKERNKPNLDDGEIAPKETSLPSVNKQIEADTAKLKQLLNEFNENLRKTELIRKKIVDEIDGFVKEIDTNRKNLQTIETHYQIDLRPVHDLLDENQEKVKKYKETIKIRSNWLVFKRTKNLPELEVSDLKDYQRAVHKEILSSRSRLNNTANIPKAYQKHEEFLKQCTEADLRIKALKAAKPKQLLHALDLEKKLKALKDTRGMTWKTLFRAIPTTLWHSTDGMRFTTPINNTMLSLRKTTHPIESLIWGVLISGIHTAQLKRAIAESKSKKPMSIPKQLAECWLYVLPRMCNFPIITGEHEQELRNDFYTDINKKIEECEKKLQQHSTLLETVISQYVAPNSDWFHTMDRCISDKIGQIVTCKDKLVIPSSVFAIPYWIPKYTKGWFTYNWEYNVSYLSPKRLIEYEHKVDTLTKTLVKALNNETHLFTVGELHKKLIGSIKAAKALAEILRKKGHLAAAKRLIELCDNIKERIEKSKNSVNNLAQMKSLATRLLSLSNEINDAIRLNKPLADKSVPAIEQLRTLGDMDSPEAIELHKLAVQAIRQNIDDFIKKLWEYENIISKLDKENQLDYDWREKLVNLIEEYKSEIAPYTSTTSVQRDQNPSIIRRTLGTLTRGMVDARTRRVQEEVNIEDLTIAELERHNTNVSNITAEKIRGGKNPNYRIAQFEDKSNLQALDKALKSYQTEIENAEKFIAAGFDKKMPSTNTREQGIKDLRLLITHLQTVYSRIAQKLSCLHEMKECTKFLNKTKDILQNAVNNIKKDKPIDMGSWASMKSLETSNPVIITNANYLNDRNEKVAQHRHFRNKFLTGFHPTSEKRSKAAFKAAQEAAFIGARDRFISNPAAIAAADIPVATAAGKPFAEKAAIAGAATANYAIINNLEDHVLIPSVALSAGKAAKEAAVGDDNYKKAVAIEAAGIAVGEALKEKGDGDEEIINGAANGAAFYAYKKTIGDGTTVKQAARIAGRAAANAARHFGAIGPDLRKIAAANAGRFAVSRAKALAPGGGPAPTLQVLITAAADAAADIVQLLRGSEDEQRHVAAVAAGAAAATIENNRAGHTAASIAAHAATAAAIKAAGDIAVPGGAPALPAIDRDTVYNATLAAARAVANASPEAIDSAAASAATKAAAPIHPNNPVGPGCIQGNLTAIRNWFNGYVARIALALATPNLSPAKQNLLFDLRNNINNMHIPLIDRLRIGLPSLPVDQIRSSEQLLTYQEESMRAYCKIRSNIEALEAQINKGGPPILGHPFPNKLEWNFIE